MALPFLLREMQEDLLSGRRRHTARVTAQGLCCPSAELYYKRCVPQLLEVTAVNRRNRVPNRRISTANRRIGILNRRYGFYILLHNR